MSDSELTDEKNYETSLDPEVWGPFFWDMLFMIAFRAQKEDADKLHRLLQLLDYVIPCSDCRKSYMLFRQNEVQIPSSHQDELWAAKWLWVVHDYVNQKLNKPCITFEILRRRHAAFTFILHDIVLLDLFVFMYRSIRPSRASRVDEFVKILLEILDSVSKTNKLKTVFDSVAHNTLSVRLYNMHEQLFSLYDIPTLTVAEFHCKYGNALLP